MADCGRALTPNQRLTASGGLSRPRSCERGGFDLSKAPTDASSAAWANTTIIDNHLPKEAKPDSPTRFKVGS